MIGTGKTALRKVARERVRERSVSDDARDGARIANAVWALPEIEAVRTILLYASIGGEVPTDPIATEARRRGIDLVYPRCLPHGTAMTLHRVASETDLGADGRFGIREPARHCPPIALATIDLAFIPGLAWDRQGRRLGRGAGYYDRLLGDTEWRATRCGLFFAEQELPHIPEDPWDVRLDIVLTELEVVRPV